MVVLPSAGAVLVINKVWIERSTREANSKFVRSERKASELGNVVDERHKPLQRFYLYIAFPPQTQ